MPAASSYLPRHNIGKCSAVLSSPDTLLIGNSTHVFAMGLLGLLIVLSNTETNRALCISVVSSEFCFVLRLHSMTCPVLKYSSGQMIMRALFSSSFYDKRKNSATSSTFASLHPGHIGIRRLIQDISVKTRGLKTHQILGILVKVIESHQRGASPGFPCNNTGRTAVKCEIKLAIGDQNRPTNLVERMPGSG
jgi:hypothetical protein